jgi:hypothetical protein
MPKHLEFPAALYFVVYKDVLTGAVSLKEFRRREVAKAFVKATNGVLVQGRLNEDQAKQLQELGGI